MRPVDYWQVRQLVSMDKVLELIGWRPRWCEPAGRRGPCPVHKGSDPDSRQFAVYGGMWHCMGRCQRGGNQLDLYAAVVGKPLLEAAVELCERAGVAVPYLPRRPRQERQPRTEKRKP
jgi:DNA primase